MPPEPIALPQGFLAGHFTDDQGLTGCTVIIAPPGSVGAGEMRGGGPGTRESDLLSPATSTDGPEALLLTGGSAFGLAAADGVMGWMAENGRGHPTPGGAVPLVSAAVVFDLMLGSPTARPDAAAGRAACEDAQPQDRARHGRRGHRRHGRQAARPRALDEGRARRGDRHGGRRDARRDRGRQPGR